MLVAAALRPTRIGLRPVTVRARLTLLRSFGLACDGCPVPLPPSAQRVLAFVALHERPVGRAYVAGSLWLDAPEERAHASLRSALWRIHRRGHRLVEAPGGPPAPRQGGGAAPGA